MINSFLNNRAKKILALLFGLGLFMALFGLAQSANGSSPKNTIDAGAIAQINGTSSNEVKVNAPIVVAQSARSLAALNVRIVQLEEQVRILTGQVEGLQFQMTQMQTFLERQQEDYEFRFEQLEGGGLGKTNATPLSDGDMPIGEVSPNETQTLDNQALEAPTHDNQAIGLENSIPGQPLGVLENEQVNLSSKALDLDAPFVEIVTKADANAQYAAGFEAVKRGDFIFAEEQFRQFIALFPTHPQAPDATSWLGEALILRGDYQEAADILLGGFQSYSGSKKAPEILLKLGQALAGAGEIATACRTFEEVTLRYKDISNEIRTRLSKEINKAKC
ncbi:MAG: tol-pal system protein YbgF [Devosiaceae bacterium]|nr:tol-pal system protein YbgF [Devosiaceae bacterium]